jgi:hypothetical protein
VCDGRRFKGSTLPVGDSCAVHQVSSIVLALRQNLRSDNASGTVLQMLDNVMIADAKEKFLDAKHLKPFRLCNHKPLRPIAK